MLRIISLALAFILAHCGERHPPQGTCIESVIVVSPGYDAECPWGTVGEVTATGDGNIAFHCRCPRDGGAP